MGRRGSPGPVRRRPGDRPAPARGDRRPVPARPRRPRPARDPVRRRPRDGTDPRRPDGHRGPPGSARRLRVLLRDPHERDVGRRHRGQLDRAARRPGRGRGGRADLDRPRASGGGRRRRSRPGDPAPPGGPRGDPRPASFRRARVPVGVPERRPEVRGAAGVGRRPRRPAARAAPRRLADEPARGGGARQDPPRPVRRPPRPRRPRADPGRGDRGRRDPEVRLDRPSARPAQVAGTARCATPYPAACGRGTAPRRAPHPRVPKVWIPADHDPGAVRGRGRKPVRPLPRCPLRGDVARAGPTRSARSSCTPSGSGRAARRPGAVPESLPPLVRAGYTSAELVANFGERALLALAARGVGPETARRLLSRPYRQTSELVAEIVKAERSYAKNRAFWA